MSDFYSDMQNVAKSVLKDFNQGEIAYVQMVPGNGPADNPGSPTPVTTVFEGATARGVEWKFLSNTNVLASDLQITIPGGIVEPEPEGYFTVDGTHYKIVEIRRTPAAGTVVTYTVIVRK